MLDMGFLPDIRRMLRQLPARSGRRCSSARRCRREIATLAHEMLRDPVTINLERKSAPAVGITQAVYPVARELKSGAARRAAEARHHRRRARVHAHEAPRQPAGRVPRAPRHLDRADSRESQPEPAHGGARRIQVGQVPRARRHRHRRPRHRRRGARPRRQLRRAGRARRLHPSRRPHGPRRRRRATRSRSSRRTKERICARSSGRSARPLPRVTLPDFDYAKKTDRAAGDSDPGAPGRRARDPAAAARPPGRASRARPRAAEARPRAAAASSRQAEPGPRYRNRPPETANHVSRASRTATRPAQPQPQSRPSGAAPHGRPRTAALTPKLTGAGVGQAFRPSDSQAGLTRPERSRGSPDPTSEKCPTQADLRG